MVQVLDKAPSFSELFSRNIGRSLGQAGSSFAENAINKRQAQQQQLAMEQENQAISQLLGQDISGIRDPNLKKAIVEKLLTGQAEQNKQQMKNREKLAPLQGGLETIKAMRQLGETGHLGPKISQGLGLGLLSGDVRKDRAKYEQLGKSLISLSSNIPIRNQREFETLAEKLYDPTINDASREGILEAMEQIINSSMSGLTQGTEESMEFPKKEMERPVMKFDISNPEHKKRRDQVLKKTRGNREKAEQILRKEFEL